MNRIFLFSLFVLLPCCRLVRTGGMERIAISPDGRSFVLERSGRTFTPWGFNYDRDENLRLLEDYWSAEWEKVREDFGEMKSLGANVVRIHLQLGKFMEDKETPNRTSLNQLKSLTRLAEDLGLYLDITGLGCYHKKEVPSWYDTLSEQERWGVQARFWAAVAKTCARSPAVFCYDLMNEPVVSGSPRKPEEWLAGEFAGKHYVQFISLNPGQRKRSAIAAEWIRRLSSAIRAHDPKRPITVGLVDWSIEKGELTSGFDPNAISGELDFFCVHLYPAAGNLPGAMETLKAFSLGKPLVIEETFPMFCSISEFEEFIASSHRYASGWISFYWGRTVEEYSLDKDITAAVMVQLLRFWESRAPDGKPTD